jgi:hypothetical protein
VNETDPAPPSLLAEGSRPTLAAGGPTPWKGRTERLGIGASLLGVAVLATALWRRQKADA